MPEEKLYCPEFVFDICVGLTVHDFLTKEFTLPMVAKKYAAALSEHYTEITEEELSFSAEEITRFMSEQKNPQYEAHEKINFFIHFRLKFDGIKGKRKLKGIFGNAFKGDKEKCYDSEKTVTNFKAFTYALRAGNVKRSPPGWHIKTERDLMQLGEIISKEIKIDELM